jgi:hypothetical protein
MVFARRIDRAFQWAGEKMGSEAKTTHSDDFRMLEAEMALRNDGTEKLQKSMSAYNKWISRRCDAFEDKERASPIGFLGRTMTAHGETFDQESEFGNCLVAMGSANERVAALQDAYVDTVAVTWMEHLERNVAMMKEYTAARKKLENRRLAYDASTTKLEKARRDDYRIEEEVRMNKAKFDETTEDVFRRMQDIKDAEPESIDALTSFLDAELEYHERAAEELRRARQAWTTGAAPSVASPQVGARRGNRSRSNTARSWQEPRQAAVYEEAEPVPALPVRPSMNRSPTSSRAAPPQPPSNNNLHPTRPMITRASTSDGRTALVDAHRGVSGHRLSRIATDSGTYGGRHHDDVFADDASTASGSGSPDWGERSASPATSYGSMSRSASAMGNRKAPPPPPPNRAKKPPPPIPTKRVM